jgi:heat shock protein 5
MSISGKDYLDSSLSSSLGTGDYRGIFFKHLKRGVTLPCCETTTTTTIYDNQESLLVEIFQGERPLTRHCSLLGSLNVTDLPAEKAEMVLIEVTLTIDRDEVLTVKAKELKTNKKLSVVIEKAHMKTNADNMVIEAIDNKIQDERLVAKLNELDKLVESVRKKYGNQVKTMDKMNEFVDIITEKEQTIDLKESEELINDIKEYLSSRKLSLVNS